jgi:hypothetical protein
MPNYIELIVTRTLVPHADRACSGRASSHPDESETNALSAGHDLSCGAHGERVRELRRRVEAGDYDNRSTMEEVARRILQRGDL